MNTMRIGLTGYARAGKDEVCRILMDEYGLKRVAFGDHIKSDMDDFIQKKFGFSAFTENDAQKSLIRGLLIEHGYARYDYFLQQLMSDLPERCVNARIFRVEEAVIWRNAGGTLYRVARPGNQAAEPKEEAELRRLHDGGFISGTLINSGSLADLRHEVMHEFGHLVK